MQLLEFNNNEPQDYISRSIAHLRQAKGVMIRLRNNKAPSTSD